MPLENAQYINSLDPTNPSSTDGLLQGDDHIRLLKAVLKTTFPNIAGAVTLTDTAINALTLGLCPIGAIIAYDGDVASLPANWAVCDGTNGTPDLRDQFLVGSSATKAAKTKGGLASTTGNTSTDGAHNHTVDTQGSHSHGGNTQGHALTIAELAAHTHTLTLKVGGGGGVQPIGGTNDNSLSSPQYTTDSTGSGTPHSHPISTDGAHTHNVSGGAHAHTLTVATVPPYYAVVYIRRMS